MEIIHGLQARALAAETAEVDAQHARESVTMHLLHGISRDELEEMMRAVFAAAVTLSGHAFWSIALVCRAPGLAACASRRHARARLCATRSRDSRVSQNEAPLRAQCDDQTCEGAATSTASSAQHPASTNPPPPIGVTPW